MKKYHMELTNDDAKLVLATLTQGIDSHLQGVTDSSFRTEYFNGVRRRLVCDVAPNDLRVIIRRLLETETEPAEMLVYSIADSLGIDEISLATEDRFYISLYDDVLEKSDCLVGGYVSVFNDDYWPVLFEEILGP